MPRFFGLCYLESLAHDLGHYLRHADLSSVFGDRLEQVDQIENLMTFFVHPRGRSLTGDGDHRGTVHIGIRYAGDQISRTRTKGR